MSSSSASSLPVRTRVQTASDADVRQLNDDEGHTYGRAFEPAEKALRRLRGQRSANDERLASWHEHPDERVPLELVARYADEDTSDGWWSGEGGRELGLDLIDRAQSDAQSEGLAWTPLLDALAHTKVDPWPGDRSIAQGALLESRGLATLSEQLEALDEALEAVTDPRELDILLDFNSKEIWRRVAHHPSLDVRHVDRILGERPRLGEMVAGNEHLSEELQHRMIHRSLDTLETLLERARARRAGREGDDDADAPLPGGDGWIAARGGTYDAVGHGAVDTIRALWWGYQTAFDERALERIVSLTPDLDEDHHPGLHGLPDVMACDLLDRMLNADVPAGTLVDALPADTLERLFTRVAPNPVSLRLLSATASTPGMWQRALERAPRHRKPGRLSLWAVLAHHDRARKHPEVWSALLADGPVRVFSLALEGQPESRRDEMCERLYEIIDEDLDVNLGRSGRPAFRAAELLLDTFVGSDASALRFYHATRDATRWTRGLMERASLSGEVVGEILRTTNSRDVRLAALRTGRLRTLPAVREALADTRDTDLLPRLLLDAEGEEFARFFRRLHEKAPDRAIGAFLSADLHQLGGLSSEELVDLLGAEERKIRLQAMLALGEHHSDRSIDQEGRSPRR